MKNTWVLSIKTSLPKTCSNATELKTTVYAFDSFENARTALRSELKKITFSKNKMFDGNGGIIYLNKYLKNSDDEYCEDTFLSKTRLSYICELLLKIFEGEDVKPKLKTGVCTDWMVAYKYKNGTMNFYGDDDGPCNGYDPIIKTNMFEIKEEKHYFLYIDDCLGQEDASSELYIDLMKAEEY